MKIPGTYQNGAQTPDETVDVPFATPGEPLLQYGPTGMSPIPNTYSNGASNDDVASTQRVPYDQQASGVNPMPYPFKGNSPDGWGYTK